MTKPTETLVEFPRQSARDVLTEVLRTGARQLLATAILPPYLRKTPSLEALYPWLSLKGLSTGDFGEALQALLGADAQGLSATTITRLKTVWEQEYHGWSKRALAGRRYVYVRKPPELTPSTTFDNISGGVHDGLERSILGVDRLALRQLDSPSIPIR